MDAQLGYRVNGFWNASGRRGTNSDEGCHDSSDNGHINKKFALTGSTKADGAHASVLMRVAFV